MLIDFQQKLLDLDGKPYKQGVDEMTLDVVAEIALTMPTETNNKLPLDKKLHRALLAEDIHRHGQVDVPAADIVIIQEAIGEMGYNFLIIKACVDILDPKPKEVKNKKAE